MLKPSFELTLHFYGSASQALRIQQLALGNVQTDTALAGMDLSVRQGLFLRNPRAITTQFLL